jgi:hypothetical protein
VPRLRVIPGRAGCLLPRDDKALGGLLMASILRKASWRVLYPRNAGGLPCRSSSISNDAEAILCLVDVLTGKRPAGSRFVDPRDRTKLSPFFAVAVQNCEAALRDQRTKPPKARSGK